MADTARGSPTASSPSGSSCSRATSPTAAWALTTPTTSGWPPRSPRVFHLAAIYDLAVPVELAQRVNVDGTGNVLELCLAASGSSGSSTSDRLRRRQAHGRRLRARARDGPGLQEPLRVHQVPGRGLGPRADRPRARPRSCGPRSWSATRGRARPRSSTARTTCCARSRAPQRRAGRAAVRPVGRAVQRRAGRLRRGGDRCRGRRPGAAGQTLHLVDPEPLSSRELVAFLSQALRGPRAARARRARGWSRRRCARRVREPSAARRASRSPTSTTP